MGYKRERERERENGGTATVRRCPSPPRAGPAGPVVDSESTRVASLLSLTRGMGRSRVRGGSRTKWYSAGPLDTVGDVGVEMQLSGGP